MNASTGWVAVLTILATGCSTSENPKPAQDSEKPSLAAHVMRGKEIRKNENTLRQIALFYQSFVNDNGKPPASLDDFKKYIQRDGREETKALDEGRIILVLNVNPGSQNIVAYEKDVDINGSQAVAMGDATVKTLPPDQLKAALSRSP